MSSKDRRIAARQAQLASRGRRRARPVPMAEPQLFKGGAPEVVETDQVEASAAPVTTGSATTPRPATPQRAVTARMPVRPTVASAIERSATFQIGGGEVRKITVISVIMAVILAVLTFVLR